MSNTEYGFRHGPTNTNTPGAGTNSTAGTNGVTDTNSATRKTTADVTRSVAMAAHQAVDAVTEKAAEAERKLRESAANNEEALRQTADKTALKANELKAKAQRYVNEKPIAAAGIAFLAGVVAAAWLRK